MNKLLLIAGFVLLTSFGVSTEYGDDIQFLIEGDTLKTLEPKEEHPSEAYVITNLLKRIHYRKLPLSDSISSVIFDTYFESLDPNKAYFYASDLEAFEKYRYELDDQIPEGELQFAYDVFDVYRKRALSQIDHVFELLQTEFDFSKDETYVFDRDDVEWPKNQAEQNEVWRKIIKNQALSYKLAGREWDDISESLTKRYQRIQKAIYQYNSEDVFQSYMNAYTNSYDPHTDYFSPPDAENFQIDMSLSLEGIGARLMQNLDYTQVAEIIPGGPAYKSKQLQKDDKIIGVAQGDDGEFLDVIGWRLDDVVSKIRGAKGSVVRLQILKASEGINALPDTLRLVRDKINLEQQAAKSEMIPITEGNTTYNLGVITVPSFYLNFEELRAGKEDYRSTTRDVKKLITELEGQGMDGLLIDLRFNGGGSLQEAIEMSGLFIPDGPVVQVRNYDQSVDKMDDEDGGEVFYDGPLAVLVNRGSASASEIFSGAIQDYRRGVIIGESTFGKGTVQNVIDLSRYIRNPELNLGQIKMTLAKFYRVTGSSNQRVGIAPDVQFPSIYDADNFGEASRENALPWDEIASAKYSPTNTISEELLDYLNELYREDLNKDPDLQKLVRDIERAKENRNRKSVSLNLETRKANTNNDEDDLATAVDDGEVVDKDEIDEKLKKDPYLKESLKLLAAMKKFKVG
ncbi:carboxyl-terminal processing protease [Ekhidna lutea]|uniref:Carboxyl-terminal processing protease n=1 Tax=Ekhidna lutea TaxID=447679 RepID=A0A239LH81_EKHLU|nr:carboxy terminal-processing peptidase [Ekhidna lutea]SNT29272.1 carboxyl-terminal processing protease [Ekhidna lutea]